MSEVMCALTGPNGTADNLGPPPKPGLQRSVGRLRRRSPSRQQVARPHERQQRLAAFGVAVCDCDPPRLYDVEFGRRLVECEHGIATVIAAGFGDVGEGLQGHGREAAEEFDAGKEIDGDHQAVTLSNSESRCVRRHAGRGIGWGRSRQHHATRYPFPFRLGGWPPGIPGESCARPMSFDVGDKVVYPHHGAAIIEKREKKAFQGEEREYFVLRIAYGDLTLMVPADNTEEIGLREVINDEEVEEVFAVLRKKEARMPTNWSRRFKNHVEKLKSGDI